jgi:tetratricopeptide (TPR) repeat protein
MAYYNRGLARLEVGYLGGAGNDLSRALELDESNADAFLARGTVLQSLNRDAEAVLDFAAALGLDELDAEAYRQRAFSWQALGEAEAAIVDLGVAIRIEPDRPELYLDRAEVRRKSGQDSGVAADETLAKLSQRIVESDDTAARRTRGQAFFAVAEYELALADLNAVLEKEPADDTALLARAQTRFVLGDDDGALADYNAVVNAGGQGVAQALAGRAVLHESLGDFAASIGDYEQAIEASPKDDDLLARCAWLLATCGNPELRDGKQAVEYARRACELTEWKDWFCLDAYAAACAETKDFAEALIWQQRAVETGPECHLGNLQKRLDRYSNRLPYHGDEADSDPRLRPEKRGR